MGVTFSSGGGGGEDVSRVRSTRERRHRTRRGLSCHPLPGRGVSGGSENEARERRSSHLGHKRSVRLFSRNKRRDKYLKVQPARAARALSATKTALSGKIREARADTRPPNVWRAISREICESERVTHFVWASVCVHWYAVRWSVPLSFERSV